MKALKLLYGCTILFTTECSVMITNLFRNTVSVCYITGTGPNVEDIVLTITDSLFFQGTFRRKTHAYRISVDKLNLLHWLNPAFLMDIRPKNNLPCHCSECKLTKISWNMTWETLLKQ